MDHTGTPDATTEAEPLPPHNPVCMGCGPEAAAGYHLVVYRHGEGVMADYTFTEAHAGAPKLAHGGAVAAVCDDLLGHLLHLRRTPGVTRHLEIGYVAPVMLGERHRLTAEFESVEGRKLWSRCAGVGEDGRVRFTARALFIRVALEHFLSGMSPEERERAKAWLDEQRRRGNDVTAW